MKIVTYFCCLIILAGCAGSGSNTAMDSSKTNKSIVTPVVQSKNNNQKAITPYKLVDDYMVTDTGFFDFGLGDGVYAVVKRNNRLVDTIDKEFGFRAINDGSYMYYVILGNGPAIEPNRQYQKSISASFGSFIIINGDKKIDVSKTAPDLGWFANLTILNHQVYYWQVKKSGDTNKIFAAEFDPKTCLTKSYYLFNNPIDADDPGYFAMPYLKSDTICFEANDGKISKFSSDFKPYN